MNVLLYSHHFAPSIGGVENVVLSIARGIAEANANSESPEFKVTVVTQTPVGDFDDSRFPFRVLRQPGVARLWQEIRVSDVVHVAGPALAPLVLGLITRKPLLVEHHGFQTICPTGQLLIEPGSVPCPGYFMAGNHRKCLRCRSDRNWLRSWELWFLTFARRFLCSRMVANITPTDFLGSILRLPNSRTIPHGVEVTAPSRCPPLRSDPPLIVFQGRLVSTKGIRVLLEAASHLRSAGRSFEVVIIGDGPERTALEDLMQKLKLCSCIRFVGRLEAAQVESVLAGASLVVVPSLGGEVFGLVVAENMSRGLPVVVSKLGAFTEVLGDAGLTFNVGDPIDLARQLTRVLDDPPLLSTLGKMAKQRVADLYDRERMVEAHAQLYRELHEAKSA